MDDVIEAVVVLVKSIFLIIIASVKACLPKGILPRKDVRGQKILITGSGNGLGRLMAIEFGKLGAELILWDINESGNLETKAMLEKIGVKATAHTVDLSKKEAINSTAAKVKADVGKIDILINNAGIVTGKKLFDCPDELMEKTMAVNTNALFFTTKNFLPAMLEENHGHIVTIASMAGKVGCAGLVDYCASKFGAVGFNESLTAELSAQKKDGVKTTVVCPYYINTGMFDGVQTKFPTLMPILEPDDVVADIMEAVLTDKMCIAMPKTNYAVLASLGLLPSEVLVILQEYFGINQTMDHFRGRVAQKA